MTTPQSQLNGFIRKYSPAVAKEGRAALAAMRRLLPAAVQLVYDNYNFLVVGFGPSERTSEAVMSIAFAPRWIVLFFLQGGPRLPDPHKILRGSGGTVRHVRLDSAKDLARPAVRALIKAALVRAGVPVPTKGKGPLIIKSVSAKQRPRRPR
jgi:hypothetical protein